MTRILVLIVKLYQYLISPMMGPSCRYTPTCSEYTLQALNKYGSFKGLWLGAKRVGRCHPWHDGGYDPLP